MLLNYKIFVVLLSSVPGRTENRTPLRFTSRGVLLCAEKQKLRGTALQGPLTTHKRTRGVDFCAIA